MIIVFPVAGRGSRFYPESTKVPKCLLPVRGRLMIEWALDSICCENAEVVIIYHKDQLPLIKHTLKGLIPKAKLVEQTTTLRGVADTVYQIRTLLQHKQDVVVVDCDIYAKSAYQNKEWNMFDGDGSVLTFTSRNPSKSYVRICGGYVVDAVEKEVVSDNAIGGIYHFCDGDGLLEAIQEEIENEEKMNEEFYLSKALKIYLKSHPAFVPVIADTFFDIGIPEGVKAFEKCSVK